MSDSAGISIVIPVTERHAEFGNLYRSYAQSLGQTGRPLQFIFVVDGGFADSAKDIRRIDAGSDELDVVTLTRVFGESAALNVGFDRARHDLIMTLPAYQQVDPEGLPKLVEAIDEADMVVVRRSPRIDSRINQWSGRLFNLLLRGITHTKFRDIGCGVRLMRRSVVDEISIYGDQHRFLPILADRKGFRVSEIEIAQAASEASVRVYRPGVYLSRLIDLMGVFFVVRFTKKPLRFFGMLGSTMLGVGGLILLVVALQRLFLATALADRPVLLLGSLFVVLGVQLFAVGLIGELIIFTHARDLKEYAVGEMVNMDEDHQLRGGGRRDRPIR
jgi:glycosyltransferase involved in cell wall biosynthesis